MKKRALSRKKAALLVFTALIVLAAALLAVEFGGAAREGWRIYKDAIPNDAAVYGKVDELRSEDGYAELGDISETFQTLLLRSEDRRFYRHNGVDPIGVARAVYVNIKNGRVVQGASTITMQLARNMFFTSERTAVRKAAEVLAAFKLESLLTKDDILELYCNIAYFGEGCYGIRAASEYYYGVEPSALDERQSAALVYTLRAPSVYNPAAEAQADHGAAA